MTFTSIQVCGRPRRAGPRVGVSAAVLGLILGLTLAPCLAPTAGASDGDTRALTLDGAVAIALERNLGLEATRDDYEAAKWGLRSARASLLPSFGLSSTARRVDPDTYNRANASLDYIQEFGIDVEPFLYETTYETSFYVTMPIWNGGKLWGAVGAAGGGRDAALHAYESARRSVIVQAESAYFDLLRAQALMKVQEEALQAATDNADAAERRLDVGLSNRADYLRWKAQQANEQTKLIEARGGLDLARTQLLNVLGMSLDTTPVLGDVGEGLLEAAKERYEAVVGDGDLTEERVLELL